MFSVHRAITILSLLCSFQIQSIGVALEQPNVIIIYGDDVGYGDVGVYGSEKIPTPHIDALAAMAYALWMPTAQRQLVALRDSLC